MVLRQRSLFRAGLKKEITIGRQWLTFVVCASVRLRRFMGIFPRKARPAYYPKTHSQRRRTSVRKIFLICPVEMAKKEILSNQFALATSDVQSILEILATDEIHMEDRNHGRA